MALIDSFLAEILRCPCTHHATLSQDELASQLVCDKCDLRFQVRDDIPNMILEEAQPGPNYKPEECSAPEVVGKA